MVEVAVIVVGSVQDKTKLVGELKAKLQKQKSLKKSCMLLFCKSLDDPSFFKTELKCNLLFIEPQVNKENPIDMIFKVKQKLDNFDILECKFVANTLSIPHLQEICKLLFPPLYDVSFCVSSHIQRNFGEKIDKVETEVTAYLSSISSTNNKPVVIFHSKCIPKMFLHGYSSRQGGISSYGGLTSLNLCYSHKKRDSKLVIMENRARLAHAANFCAESFHLAKAVHGKDVWIYEKEEPESYDSIISNSPNVIIAAPGADCNMLLFADPVSKSCGAAHAGWKGILCGVIQATIEAMVKNYCTNPKNLIVSIGPSLSVCCCEFGAEQAKKFLSIDEKCVIWKPECPKPFLDLRLAAKILLQQSGVSSINIDDGSNSESDLQICTKCDPNERFFSFRRVGSQFGNQVGFIGLPA